MDIKIQLITKHVMGFFRNSLAKEIRKTLANIQNEKNIENFIQYCKSINYLMLKKISNIFKKESY